MHSTGSNDGPMLDKTGPGTYYYKTFVYGRRLIGSQKDAPGHGFTVTAATLLMGDRR